MYKTVLVDDEALIRDAIRTTIPWNKFGFELIATCQNAKEVVQLLAEQSLDLVITDICMPFMDGLELSKYIYEHYPHVMVIIISGYDDFDYAKQAVRYRVQDYVLKPITAAEFSQILEKVRSLLDKQAQEQEYLNKMKHTYDENLPTLKNRFLAGLISPSPMAADYISDKLEEFQTELKGPYYVCAILEPITTGELENSPSFESLSAFSVFSTARDIMYSTKAGEMFQDSSSRTILYFSAPTKELVFSTAKTSCLEIHELVTSLLHIQLNITIGKPVYTLHKLPISYQSACSLLENFFLMGSNQILIFSDFSTELADTSINRGEWTNKILDFIKTNKMEELDFLLEQFIQTLRNNHVPKQKVILYIQSVVLSIMNFLDNTVFYSDSLFEEEQNLFDQLSNMEQLSEMGEALTEFCHCVSAGIHSRHEDYNQKQAQLALDFIEQNYSQPNLSLSDVCTHLSMSTSRFSTIFKSSTGETFVEALTRIRMEHAKHLMAHTSLKAYEIAEQVGFTDPHYFSIAFKKHTKMTPTKYIKSQREV